jgi:glucokinase
MKKLYLGVDLGGTNVRSGLVDEDGNLISLDSRPSMTRISAEKPVQQMVDSLKEAARKGGVSFSDIKGIGIGSPGPLSAKEGKILKAGNLPHWVNFPLTSIITERTGIKTFLQNDANMFAYGEWWKGAGQGLNDFFAITLGTGIGGGAVCGGRLLTGFNDNSAEFGHTSVDFNGFQCWCGQKGCIELYASATGIVRITKEALINSHIDSQLTVYRDKPDELSSKAIFDAAQNGDKFAVSMFDKAGYMLGLALVNALNLLNFERIAVGGGLAGAGDFMLEPARRALHERGFSSYNFRVSIIPAAIPEKAAILGSVRWAMEMEEKS